jgi:hypothetical protein
MDNILLISIMPHVFVIFFAGDGSFLFDTLAKKDML